MNAELQKAIECLRIQDVYLRNSQGDLMEGFDPKYSPEANDLAVQFKHVVTCEDVLQLQEDEKEVTLFRVHIDLGARWVVLPEPKVEGGSEEKEEENIKAVIEATFLAEYLIEGEPGQKALD
ncbi:preprotein translocase subunit SecB, partial [Thiolapillus sp.]